MEILISNKNGLVINKDVYIKLKFSMATKMVTASYEGQEIDIFNADSIMATNSYEGQEVGTFELGSILSAFDRRKTQVAVIKEVREGEFLIQVVRFVDLHRHSGYSLLDGGTNIGDMVKKTEYAGAITDHGVMYGTLEYYKQMKKAGKKPILGFEAYTETIDGKKESHHLLLLAKNKEGYANLTKLSSVGFENFYYKPQLSYDMLRKHSNGVIASSACLGGEISQALINGNYEEAKRVAIEMISIFGKEDFYIEIQRHGIGIEDIVNPQLIQIARELDLKIIATTDSHYTNKGDTREHEILLCIGTGKTMDDEKRFKFSGTGYHIHTPEEVEELFSDIPEALDNTIEIAEKCTLELDLGKIYMPHFTVPVPFADETAYFKFKAWEGFDERFTGTPMHSNPEYRERLQFEIDTIVNMGFPGYFLIVWDFIDFSKKNGILVGPGRGSACGSLVSYALSITQIDPIPYGLLFERFLNPDRVSMPDIDLDFDDVRREEVINYVKGKYGVNAVSRIITFGTLSAKAVVRDVTRVLSKPYSLGDKISKSIPAVPKMTLKKALIESIEFKTMYESDSEVKEIVDTAMKLEGLPRNISQHACGVIIAPSAVSDYIPQILIENEATGEKEPTTQFTMSECEEMGLLKMDFLGLRTMGVVSRALRDINPKRIKQGLDPIEFLDIPTNDVRVYDFIAKGNTEGVFQLESGGMTSFMKELFQDVQNTSIEMFDNLVDKKSAIDSKVIFNKSLSLEAELSKIGSKGSEVIKKLQDFGRQLFERAIAGISLYRPGPIDEIPNYINNMLHPDYIQYETPELEPLLNNTYGIIVYQEQCMFIVRELAGFTKGMADSVRKAMSKKKEDMLAELGQQFIYGEVDKDGNVIIDGCIKRGISEEIAIHIWEKMKKFGQYAFNKSHAGGYAEIALRTGWLAYYYPTEYMCATLNSFITKADRIKMYMSVCKKKSIQILPPDVNHSREVFTVDGESIRFGLMGIKNMGKISKSVILERDIRGEFDNFQDFAERMAKNYKVDKRLLEALIYSSAVDSFKGTRRAKLSVLDKILDSASIEKKNFISGQIDLFSLYEEFAKYKEIEIPEMEEFDKKLKLDKEKEFAGFYVTEHPLDDYTDYFAKEGVNEIGFLQGNDDEIEDEEDSESSSYNHDGEVVKIAGIIKDLKIFYTKKDQKPLYVFQVEDKTGEMKAVIFSNKIELNQDKLVEGKVVIVQGQLKQDDFGVQIIVRNIYDIEAVAKSEKPKAVWVKATKQEQIKELNAIVNNNRGSLPVYIRFEEKNYKTNNQLELNFATFSKLQEVFGTNVKVVYEK